MRGVNVGNANVQALLGFDANAVSGMTNDQVAKVAQNLTFKRVKFAFKVDRSSQPTKLVPLDVTEIEF